MTNKANDSGIRQDEYDRLQELHGALAVHEESLQGEQRRKFEQIEQQYRQFQRTWRSGQGEQSRQAYDALRMDMQRLLESFHHEPVGAGVEDEEEEEH